MVLAGLVRPVREIPRTTGRISRLVRTETSVLNKVGSVIQDLSKSCTSSRTFLVHISHCMHKTSGEIHALEYNIPYRAIASRYVRLPDVFSPISSVAKSRLSLGDGLQSESVRPVLGTTGLVRPVLEICWTASFSPVQS